MWSKLLPHYIAGKAEAQKGEGLAQGHAAWARAFPQCLAALGQIAKVHRKAVGVLPQHRERQNQAVLWR